VAAAYAKYRIKNLQFRYVSRSSTFTSGTVALGYHPDPKQRDPINLQEILAFRDYKQDVPYNSITLSRTASNNTVSSDGWLFCEEESDDNVRWTDDGVLFIATSGISSSGTAVPPTSPIALGSLHIDYTIELAVPEVSGSTNLSDLMTTMGFPLVANPTTQVPTAVGHVKRITSSHYPPGAPSYSGLTIEEIADDAEEIQEVTKNEAQPGAHGVAGALTALEQELLKFTEYAGGKVVSAIGDHAAGIADWFLNYVGLSALSYSDYKTAMQVFNTTSHSGKFHAQTVAWAAHDDTEALDLLHAATADLGLADVGDLYPYVEACIGATPSQILDLVANMNSTQLIVGRFDEPGVPRTQAALGSPGTVFWSLYQVALTNALGTTQSLFGVDDDIPAQLVPGASYTVHMRATASVVASNKGICVRNKSNVNGLDVLQLGVVRADSGASTYIDSIMADAYIDRSTYQAFATVALPTIGAEDLPNHVVSQATWDTYYASAGQFMNEVIGLVYLWGDNTPLVEFTNLWVTVRPTTAFDTA